MKTQEALFHKKALWILWGAGLFSLALSLYLLMRTDPSEGEVVSKQSALSRSLIGYRALARLLESFDINVSIQRFSPERLVKAGRPLLLFEPERAHQDEAIARAKRVLERGEVVVLVLPKWEAVPLPENPEWVEAVKPLPIEEPSDLLARLLSLSEGEPLLVRPKEVTSWSAALLGEEAPTLRAPQLLSSAAPVIPIVWSEQGTLLGFTTSLGGTLYVVSDPDLFNTQGLAQGDNAIVTYRFLVERVGAEGVVFDEVIHGLGRPPSRFRELTEPPLVWITLHLLGLLLLGVWAAVFRFGAPEPLPSRLPPGKEILLESASSLLATGGDLWSSVRQYRRILLLEVAHSCALPAELEEAQLLSRLGYLARQRKTTVDIEAVSLEIDRAGPPKKALILAGMLYRWRQEMLRGTS